MRERLIVGYDGSAGSLSAARWAAREAELRNAPVRIVGASSMPIMTDPYGFGLAGAISLTMHDLEEAAASRCAQLVDDLLGEYPRVGVDIAIRSMAPVTALVDESRDAALVVVGASGTGVRRSIVLGSVTTNVLCESRCPVVVVPTKVHEPTGRILVGVDGSSHSDAALRWAVAEAELRGSELVVLHAWDDPYRLTGEGLDRADTMGTVDAAIVVDRAVEMCRELSGLEIERRLVNGRPKQALLDAGELVDLIVVGSRGRGGFTSMLLGSVALAVAGHAACPVAVVH